MEIRWNEFSTEIIKYFQNLIDFLKTKTNLLFLDGHYSVV